MTEKLTKYEKQNGLTNIYNTIEQQKDWINYELVRRVALDSEDITSATAQIIRIALEKINYQINIYHNCIGVTDMIEINARINYLITTFLSQKYLKLMGVGKNDNE